MCYICNKLGLCDIDYLIMKLSFCVFAFCVVTVCAHSQELTDTVCVRVQYHALYKHTQEQKEAYDDTNLLDIGKHSSRFYSQRFEMFLHQRDSVRNATSDPMGYLQFLANRFGAKKGREYEVYKHTPEKGTLTYTDVLHNDFFFCYEESIPTFSWQLAEGDTLIIGYTCHKAVCQFRGRAWTAWYTLDLPFDNGPWKLGGLPGLILAASESRNEFSFVATGIEQLRQTATIGFQPKRYERLTPAKFQRLLTDYWKDQWNTTNRLQGAGYSEPPGAQRSFNACLIDKYE